MSIEKTIAADIDLLVIRVVREFAEAKSRRVKLKYSALHQEL